MSGIQCFSKSGVLTFDASTQRAGRLLGFSSATQDTVVTDNGFLTGTPYAMVLGDSLNTSGTHFVRPTTSFSGNQMTLSFGGDTTANPIYFIYGVF